MDRVHLARSGMTTPPDCIASSSSRSCCCSSGTLSKNRRQALRLQQVLRLKPHRICLSSCQAAASGWFDGFSLLRTPPRPLERTSLPGVDNRDLSAYTGLLDSARVPTPHFRAKPNCKVGDGSQRDGGGVPAVARSYRRRRARYPRLSAEEEVLIAGVQMCGQPRELLQLLEQTSRRAPKVWSSMCVFRAIERISWLSRSALPDDMSKLKSCWRILTRFGLPTDQPRSAYVIVRTMYSIRHCDETGVAAVLRSCVTQQSTMDDRVLCSVLRLLGELQQRIPGVVVLARNRDEVQELIGTLRLRMRSFGPREVAMLARACARLRLRDRPFLNAIARRIYIVMHQMKASEVDHSLWAFASLRHRDNQLLTAARRQIVSKIDSFLPRNLSSCVWALTVLGVRDEELMAAVGRWAVSRVDQLGAQALVTILWSFASLGVEDKELFNVLGARAEKIMPEFTGQGLANLLWAHSRAGVFNGPLMSAAAAHALCIMDSLTPQEVCNTVSAFAAFNVVNPRLMQAAARRTLAVINGCTMQTVVMNLWAYVRVHMYHSELFPALASRFKQLLEAGSGREAAPQAADEAPDGSSGCGGGSSSSCSSCGGDLVGQTPRPSWLVSSSVMVFTMAQASFQELSVLDVICRRLESVRLPFRDLANIAWGMAVLQHYDPRFWRKLSQELARARSEAEISGAGLGQLLTTYRLLEADGMLQLLQVEFPQHMLERGKVSLQEWVSRKNGLMPRPPAITPLPPPDTAANVDGWQPDFCGGALDGMSMFEQEVLEVLNQLPHLFTQPPQFGQLLADGTLAADFLLHLQPSGQPVILEVDGRFHYLTDLAGGHPVQNGRSDARNRLLNQAGYPVVCINMFDWTREVRAASGSEDRARRLQGLLLEALSGFLRDEPLPMAAAVRRPESPGASVAGIGS